MNKLKLLQAFYESPEGFVRLLSEATGKTFLNPSDAVPYIDFTKEEVIKAAATLHEQKFPQPLQQSDYHQTGTATYQSHTTDPREIDTITGDSLEEAITKANDRQKESHPTIEQIVDDRFRYFLGS